MATNSTYSFLAHEAESTALPGVESIYRSTARIMDRADWMGDMLSTIGTESLSEITIPGSHDAGMYSGSELAFTQALTLRQQLEAGSRYFDLRVKAGNTQYIHHGGLEGPPVEDVLRDIKNFMQEGHKEVVVLKFSHFTGNFGADQYTKLVNSIRNELGPWLYTDSTHPARDSINQILSREDGRVIVVVDGNWAYDQRTDGFYVFADWCAGDRKDCDSTWNPERGQFNVDDRYSNTTNYDSMKNDQLAKLARYDGYMKNLGPDGARIPCDMFLLSWTLTPVTNVGWVSIPANQQLYNVVSGIGRNSNGKLPNILYVDYFERSRVRMQQFC